VNGVSAHSIASPAKQRPDESECTGESSDVAPFAMLVYSIFIEFAGLADLMCSTCRAKCTRNSKTAPDGSISSWKQRVLSNEKVYFGLTRSFRLLCSQLVVLFVFALLVFKIGQVWGSSPNTLPANLGNLIDTYLTLFCVGSVFRFAYYRRKRWHYFMFDFCYFITWMEFLYFYVLSSFQSEWIRTVLRDCLFSMATGPALIAIFVWRNKFMLQDVDKAFSVFMHLMPAVIFHFVMFKVGSLSGSDVSLPLFFGLVDRRLHVDMLPTGWIFVRNVLALPQLLFMAWQMAYIILVYVLLKQPHGKAGASETGQSYMCKNTNSEMFVYLRQFTENCGRLQTIAFVIFQFHVHVIMTIVALLAGYNGFFHVLFVVLVFMVAAHSGAQSNTENMLQPGNSTRSSPSRGAAVGTPLKPTSVSTASPGVAAMKTSGDSTGVKQQ